MKQEYVQTGSKAVMTTERIDYEELLKELREKYKNGSYKKSEDIVEGTVTFRDEYRRYMRSISAPEIGGEHTEDDSLDDEQRRCTRARSKNGSSTNSGKSKKIKLQKKRDSKGRELSPGQQEFFKDSIKATYLGYYVVHR